jgi:hypothetical protein
MAASFQFAYGTFDSKAVRQTRAIEGFESVATGQYLMDPASIAWSSFSSFGCTSRMPVSSNTQRAKTSPPS